MRQIPILTPPKFFDPWNNHDDPDVIKGKEILMGIHHLIEDLPNGWSIEILVSNNTITPGQVMAEELEEEEEDQL